MTPDQLRQITRRIDTASDAACTWAGCDRRWFDNNATITLAYSPETRRASATIAVEGIYGWSDWTAAKLNQQESPSWLYEPVNGYTIGIYELPDDYSDPIPPSSTTRKDPHVDHPA